MKEELSSLDNDGLDELSKLSLNRNKKLLFHACLFSGQISVITIKFAHY